MRGETLYEIEDALSQHVMTIGRGHRETQHDGYFWSDAFGFFKGYARVLRIENRLYQKYIDTAINQRLYLFCIRIAQDGFAKWFATGCNGCCTACRSNASSHVTGLVRRTEFVGTFAGYLSGSYVDFPAIVLQTVIAHRDALGVECVGLNDICPSGKVLTVDIADNERSSQRQHVIASFQVLRVVGKAGTTEVFFT